MSVKKECDLLLLEDLDKIQNGETKSELRLYDCSSSELRGVL